MRVDGYLAHAIPTVAPTAPAVTRDIQLQPTGSRHYVVTGTAVGNNLVLPDARQCPLGAVIQVENGSSEFVGLHQFGTAAFLTRIPPRGTSRITLTAKATAAGTWAGGSTDLGAECRGNLVLYGNFATYATTATTNDGGYHYLSGAGALSRSTFSSDIAVAAAMGYTNSWWYGYCGTANAGTASVKYGSTTVSRCFVLTSGPYMYEANFSIDALPTAAEDWTVSLGMANTTANFHARMILDLTVGGGTNYHLQTQDGAGATNTNSGVVAAARTPTRMRIEKTRAGNRQDLWINGVWRCQSAGGPTAGNDVGFGAQAQGVATAGGTTRGMCLGYHRVIQAPATPII
jgi:hypothetical protein